MRFLARALFASSVAGASCHLIGGADEYTVRDEAAGGGAGAAATSSSQSGAAGGGGATPEECLNGVDDDGDGDADCKDPDCVASGYQSVQGTAATTFVSAGTCGAELVEHVFHDCDACGCDADVGTCTLQVTLFKNASCDPNIGTNIQFDPSTGTCQDAPACTCRDIADFKNGGVVSAAGAAVPALAAQCNPSVPTVVADGLSFCAPLAQGSGSLVGQVCLPPPPGAAWCVVLDAAETCPPGTSLSASVLDGGSGTCDCACQTGQQLCAANGASALTSADNACGAPTTTVAGDGTCAFVTEVHSLGFTGVGGITSDVTCASSPTMSGATSKKICCP
ncbi:MAG: hypothetical protein IT373_16480 [Polyangiaceae bacterium]|nr:hypothetical protein [Polyangiaceae bacterium]